MISRVRQRHMARTQQRYHVFDKCIGALGFLKFAILYDIPFERRRHGTKERRRYGTRRLRQHEQPKRKHGLPKWKTFSDGLQ
ncbi:hypothetical protein Tco_0684386, partial [Tanacetum coccineum]